MKEVGSLHCEPIVGEGAARQVMSRGSILFAEIDGARDSYSGSGCRLRAAHEGRDHKNGHDQWRMASVVTARSQIGLRLSVVGHRYLHAG